MDKLKNIFFTLIVFFSCIFCVNASCTDEELEILKKEANNIKVTYKHLGAVEDDNGVIYYNRFDLNFKNVPDDFYILYLDTIRFDPIDGLIKEVFINGTYTFDVYSNRCNEKISNVEVYIPKFNIYSLDKLCEGIDGKDFALCGKYYEYYVDYDDFVTRVTNYRNNHAIYFDGTIDVTDGDVGLVERIFDFMQQYKIYISIILFILIIFLAIIILVLKKRKRKILT